MADLNSKGTLFKAEEIAKTKAKEQNYRTAYIQMVDTEYGISSLKNILKNFTSWTEPLTKFIKEFIDSIKKIYKDTPFNTYIDTIIYGHELLLNEIDLLNKSVLKIYSRTSEWNTIFQQAKEKKKLRDEKKKKFEHYEEKLNKFEKIDKKKRNQEKVQRNEQKYRNAVTEYLEIADSSFDVINNSLKLGWELINPIISDLILQHNKTFNNMHYNLNEFSNIKERFEEIKQSKNESNNYDPKKYIQERKLVRCDNMRTKVNSSQHIFMVKKQVGKEKNILICQRTTNTFGLVPDEKKEKFWEIQDEPY